MGLEFNKIYRFNVATSIWLVLSAAFICLQIGCKQSSGTDYPDVENYGGDVVDLLILEGERIVPLTITKIEDKSTPKRTFMMLFLGNGKFRDALPTLERIVLDKEDPDRDAALIALFKIDNEMGTKYATLYRNEISNLGKIANDILLKKPYLFERRTYLEALKSYLERTYF